MTAFVRYAPANGIVVISTAIGALAPVEEPSTASTEHGGCKLSFELGLADFARMESDHRLMSSRPSATDSPSADLHDLSALAATMAQEAFAPLRPPRPSLHP